jgi:hypothetical protein
LLPSRHFARRNHLSEGRTRHAADHERGKKFRCETHLFSPPGAERTHQSILFFRETASKISPAAFFDILALEKKDVLAIRSSTFVAERVESPNFKKL